MHLELVILPLLFMFLYQVFSVWLIVYDLLRAQALRVAWSPPPRIPLADFVSPGPAQHAHVYASSRWYDATSESCDRAR